MKADRRLRAPDRRDGHGPIATLHGPRAGAGSAAAAGPGWLFVLPALVMYAAFVLVPLAHDRPVLDAALERDRAADVRRPRQLRRRCSPTPTSSASSSTPSSSSSSSASSRWCSGCSSRRSSGASRPGRSAPRRGRCCSCRRSSRSSRRASCGAGCCPRPASSTRSLDAIGLGGITRAWLADFGLALPAVGVIGAWVLLGLCTDPAAHGHEQDRPVAVRSRRASTAPAAWQEFRSITVPSLRYEIGVCVTVTVIAALAAFDIVYISTGGGPGIATTVPGPRDLPARVLRAAGRARLGARGRAHRPRARSSVLPIQRLTREEPA